MTTKNIFRTLLMAVMLLVGAGSVKAAEYDVAFQGNYNYQGDNFVADKSEFGNIQDGSVFRIYVSNVSANGWKLYICGGPNDQGNLSWVKPYFSDWETVDIYKWTWSDGSQGYQFNGEYFEFTCTANSVTTFQTYGLFIDNDNSYTIDRITYTTDAAIAEKYAVNLPASLTGGTITASPSRQEAGKSVTLTANPYTGYELTSIAVTDADNNAVTLSGSGNSRTFTMPAKAVTVVATFTAIDYTVTAGSGVTASKTTAHAGDEVTVTYSLPTGYELAGLSVKTAEGQAVQVSDGKFTMPAGNVTIRMDYQIVVSEATTATVLWGPSSQAIDWWNNRIELSTALLADAQVGDIIRIKGSMGTENSYFNVQFDDNFLVPNFGYSKGVAQSASGTTSVDAAISADMLQQLKNNSVRNVTGYNFTVTEIQWLHNSGSTPDVNYHTLTISIDGQTTTKQVAEGATLATVLPAAAKTGYTFTVWSGLPSDGVMPASDLTVTAQFTVNSYTITYYVDGVQYGDAEQYEYGAAVTPKAAPADQDGKVFSGWSPIPATMPAYNVNVDGSFDKAAEYVQATIGSAGYATFCSNKALDFSKVTALKAFIAKSVSSDAVALEQVTGVIAAGTGLILKGSSANIPVADSEGTTPSGNMLKGVITNDRYLQSDRYYVLAYIDGKAQFASTESYIARVRVGHAFLDASNASRGMRLRIIFPDDETTGIAAIAGTKDATAVVYDLSGRQVKSPKPGNIYIIDNKKVIWK